MGTVARLALCKAALHRVGREREGGRASRGGGVAQCYVLTSGLAFLGARRWLLPQAPPSLLQLAALALRRRLACAPGGGGRHLRAAGGLLRPVVLPPRGSGWAEMEPRR